MQTIETGVDFKPIDAKQLIPKRGTAIWEKQETPSQHDFLALIPVWNKAGHLRATLDSLKGVVNGVLVLDDGSTDQSVSIAKKHPLVVAVLEKEKKPLTEWHDAHNRHELYLAAARYSPKWVICVDADEELDPRFSLHIDSLKNNYPHLRAYAFQVVDLDGEETVRQRFGHRMYRYRKGYNFDMRRLHCRLIPLEITPEEMGLVNLTIYHEANAEERHKRYEKYQAADKQHQYQSSYEHLKNKLVSKPTVYDNDGLKVQKLLEDGLQRSLYTNYFNESYQPETFISKTLITLINKQIHTVLPYWKRYLNLRLDAYHIIRQTNGKYKAVYAYDGKKSHAVAPAEVAIIETRRSHTNFPELLALLGGWFKLNSLEAILEKWHVLETVLIEKKILKDDEKH